MNVEATLFALIDGTIVATEATEWNDAHRIWRIGEVAKFCISNNGGDLGHMVWYEEGGERREQFDEDPLDHVSRQRLAIVLGWGLRRNQPERHEQDVLVNVGNMAGARIEQVKLDASYEAMVEDYIGNFNHIVSQGISPMKALFAFTSAFAIVLGCCLRADLPWSVAQNLLRMIMKNAQATQKMVRVISTSIK